MVIQNNNNSGVSRFYFVLGSPNGKGAKPAAQMPVCINIY